MKINKFISMAVCSLVWGGCADEINVYAPTHTLEREQGYEGYNLVWAEEFDYEGLPDSKTWDYKYGQVRGTQLEDCRKEDLRCTRVENGRLIIEAFKDPHEAKDYWTGEIKQCEYSSAEIQTLKKVEFQYGRIDIAAKIPTGRGVWPALWLMPVRAMEGKYGEIDIMEYVWGNDEVHETTYSTVHTQASRDGVEKIPSGYGHSSSLEDKYHLYSLNWTEKKVEILFDNEVVFTYEKPENATLDQWPFDQPYYLILNIAVGGGWGGQWGVDEEIFPKQMEVEYIRYYQKLKNDDDSKEPEEPEEPKEEQFVPNGDFETAYDTDKGPAMVGRPTVEGDKVLDYLNRWYAMNTATAKLEVDNTNGADGSGSSLKYSIDNLPNWWSTDICLPFAGVPEGRYELSFYAKSNKDVSAYALSLNVCEAQSDISIVYKHQKALVVENGKTVIKQAEGNGDVYAIMSDKVDKNWKKYSVVVDVPKNELLKFVIKPHTACTPGKNDYKLLGNATGIEFWFDQFELKPATEEIPQEPVTGEWVKVNIADLEVGTGNIQTDRTTEGWFNAQAKDKVTVEVVKDGDIKAVKLGNLTTYRGQCMAGYTIVKDITPGSSTIKVVLQAKGANGSALEMTCNSYVDNKPVYLQKPGGNYVEQRLDFNSDNYQEFSVVYDLNRAGDSVWGGGNPVDVSGNVFKNLNIVFSKKAGGEDAAFYIRDLKVIYTEGVEE